MTRLTWLGIAAVLAAAPVLAPGSAASQEDAADPLAALRVFAGSWEGSGDGKWGSSTVTRTYEFVLDGSYLFAKNRSVYEPQERNPDGETHDDWALWSLDRDRERFVVREFHDEGMVNQYVLEGVEDGGRTMVFVTESIENFGGGWRARQTYRILGPDELEEVFELAPPDGAFSTYVTNRLKRR